MAKEAKTLRAVLVVETDDVVCELVRKLCAVMHLHAEIVATIDAARATLVTVEPIAILCGVGDGDGIAFARDLRGSQPASTTLVLLLDDAARWHEATAVGVDKILSRPIDASELVATLRAIAERAGVAPLPHVIVVEDDGFFAAVLERGLAATFAVTLVSSVDEALEHVAAHGAPDAILCELGLVPGTFHAALDVLVVGLSERTVYMTGGRVTDADGFLGRIPGRWLHKPFPPEAARALLVDLLARS